MDQIKSGSGSPDGTVVVARAQTAGRGRQQRVWHAPPEQNLTFSFLWRPVVPPDQLSSLAQAIAVGIADFLQNQGIIATIKWPNDVLVDGRKISGILCETVRTNTADDALVVSGIGLNVNLTADDATPINQPVTSLLLETGRSWCVETALEELLPALVSPLNRWAHGGFPSIRDEYTRHTVPTGTPIRVRDGNTFVEGTLAGFNHHGALQLQVADGTERQLYSGDFEAL